MANQKTNALRGHSNDANDGTGLVYEPTINAQKNWIFDDSGWLVVERTVPDANTMFYDIGTPRTIADWLKRPYANAAAVGSFMMRNTSKPAMRPASLVA